MSTLVGKELMIPSRMKEYAFRHMSMVDIDTVRLEKRYRKSPLSG